MVRRDGLVLLVIILIQVVIWEKRVRLTKKTRPGVFSHSNPDPGWGVRSASLAIFFLDLGLGEDLHLGTPRREQA